MLVNTYVVCLVFHCNGTVTIVALINRLGNSAAKRRSQPFIFWMKKKPPFVECCVSCDIMTILVHGLQCVNRQLTHCLIAAAGLRKDMDVCVYRNGVWDTWRLIVC